MPQLGNVLVKPAVDVDAAQLQRHSGEVVAADLDEPRAAVAHQAAQRVAGSCHRLVDQPAEAVGSLGGQRQGVHEVLGGLVDADQQTALLASDPDGLAVHAEDPAPRRRPCRCGDLQGGLGPTAQIVDPAVEREP